MTVPVYSYKTILAPSSGSYTEKRSKFIAFAFPISTPEEAMMHIDSIRKEYYDARHVCWAYVCGRKIRVERLNDDGEPSSTAGKPILGQIHSRELTNTLVVVIRYFGGVKLGTGGLIQAYKAAAQEALSMAEIIEHDLMTRYILKFDFDLINPVMMLLRNHGAITVDSDTDVNGYLWTIDVLNRGATQFEIEAAMLYKLKVEKIEEEED
ncbi:YigZ family protein [Porphyromonas sp.]|uniref:IMPACT family protein n=1 Tax=Porphyromonas sp. TaxID=1924944 RepID=UPI0026DAF802|nr:YigZ family protein [Porphyromonas sp.]MDO4695255.1 YigZ family protein [Porphyromonas sp.]MDO4771056.1 YigZ family protein [Porphyromonas sp.]